MKRRPLGRGLDAILGESATAARSSEEVALAVPAAGDEVMPKQEPRMVEVERITPGRGQPRRNFADTPLDELAASIKKRGVIQPLLVTETAGGFELIAGERRLRAAARAGLERVPVIIKRDVGESDLVELALIENIQREDLGPLELARAYQRLIDDLGYTQTEVAERLGKSRAAIGNTIRLLGLPSQVQQALEEELVSEGHARALLGLPTAAEQIKAARKVVQRGLSVREVEDMVRDSPGSGPAKTAPARAGGKTGATALEQSLTRTWGTKVRIRRSGKRGRIEIEFYSDEELNRLVERLGA